MRRLIVDEFLSLDGVAQGPGGADEDRDGGFEHGGWHMEYQDDVADKWVQEGLNEARGYLLGRRTYEIFAAYWPNAPKEEESTARPLNERPKYVVSSTLKTPLSWQNSSVLSGELVPAVRALLQDGDGDLHIWGSTMLVPTLLQHGLVDELRLMIDPVALGGGKRIFPQDGGLRAMRLVKSQLTSTGAILANYQPMRA